MHPIQKKKKIDTRQLEHVEDIFVGHFYLANGVDLKIDGIIYGT